MTLRVLLVKLSSLGDVVHTLPVLHDIRTALPGTEVDWVVERGFAPLVQRGVGIGRVIDCELRRWRKNPLSSSTRREWRAFVRELRAIPYDAVIDLHGLSKSALVSRLARLSAGGQRYAMANRTDGSGYEVPTRWVADVAVPMPAHVHAVQRGRLLAAAALGYSLPQLRWGLQAWPSSAPAFGPDTRPCVALVHGTSRADKQWPDTHWLELGQRLNASGARVALPHGSDAEQQRSERLAATLNAAEPGNALVWSRLSLDALTDALAACAGVVGVDSGLSHIAVALDLPHVQIYNFDTAWRTGPQLQSVPAAGQADDLPAQGAQVSVYAQPAPSVDVVWQAWCVVAGKRP